MDIGTKFGITGIFQGRFSDFTSHRYIIAGIKKKKKKRPYLKVLTLFKT